MTSTITINNVGPIKTVEFPINQVNLFIGPQSSGKSTIAKIVSFCFWLEKYVLRHQLSDAIDNSFVRKSLIAYHKMESYFNRDSEVRYVSDFLEFSYKDQDVEVVVKDFRLGVMSKVAYIPSERNILGFPNINSFNFKDDYIREFIFDWLSIRSNYTDLRPFESSRLGLSFFYSSNSGDNVIFEGHKGSLSESSSGIQSMVPLLVYLNYVLSWIYNNGIEESFERYSANQEVIMKLLGIDLLKNQSTESYKKLSEMFSKLANGNLNEDDELFKLFERLLLVHHTKVVMEEPEQNLFPCTQYDLIKIIMSWFDFGRGDQLLLTTHSPYLMTAINNLIQAGNALEAGANPRDIYSVIDPQSVLHYDNVSAWVVSEGKIRSIKDDEARLISADALDSASDYIGQDFNKLLDYEG